MSSSEEFGSSSSPVNKKFRGVRQRKWGKWVSEIRVPGTQDRLWLGSYATAEAAAVAHDIASYCLRGGTSLDGLNFPHVISSKVRTDLSPRSVQKAASDAGLAIDAQFAIQKSSEDGSGGGRRAQGGDQMEVWGNADDNYGASRQGSEFRGEEALSISIDDYL
ncbi:ethylene-responsive transcription factor ERF020-like [Vitis riparia]|uniref:ethylene-responsive transcription factor ERF020-like n=1 Tax=Vitis riparia TaxID=96939 RepID=UPI00155A8B4D|nr:ethylene-responsive transcription factor ERF020-like [Vitis riparia]